MTENERTGHRQRLRDPAEWIRHGKRAGLYEQGKLLYEKGGINLVKLPEDVMAGVAEDHQVRAGMLVRQAKATSGKKQKWSIR